MLKRSFSVFLCFIIVILSSFSVFGANLGAIGGVIAPDLKFSPDGGGKFIYCNNNEGILKTHLTDSSNPTPEYIMKNTDLGKDRYSLYLSFINRTETRFSTTNVIDEQGFDIELDVELYAKENAVLKINSVGFCVTDYDTYFENGVLTKKDLPWSSLKAVADFTKRPIYVQNSSKQYIPKEFSPKEIKLTKGETFWLSEIIEEYKSVPWLKGVHLLADIEIISGKADINICALRAKAKLGDRSDHQKDAFGGKYYRDRQYKGIADTLPSVTSDVLSYTIDEYFIGGTYLPVTVYNQFQPEGNTLTKWFTHLNPQEDIWSRDLCAESDMLGFKYIDDTKKDYYGQFIKENKKDNVWIFDVFHSDTTNWDGEDITGYKKSEYIPNYPLTMERENSGYGCNLGNYGVATNYHLKIENKSGITRYFNYHLKTTSDNIINVKDKNGNYLTDYSVAKGLTDTKVLDTLACVPLPAGEVSEFYLEVTLPTNCAGGMENSFSVTDTPTEIVFKESKTSPYLKKSNFTGKEYYKWDDGELYISKDNANFEKVVLDAKTKALFENKWHNYEIRRAGNGFIARCSSYLDTPSLYSETLKYFNNIYILDENFNVKAQKQFDAFPKNASFAFGKYYVTTKQGNFYSKDGVNWKEFLSGFSVPIYSEIGNVAISYKNGTMYVTEDGESFTPISFAKNAPSYIDEIGGYFYYADKNWFNLSKNGLHFKTVLIDEDVKSLDLINGKIFVNGKELKMPNFTDYITMNIENKFVIPEMRPQIVNGRTIVPVRSLLESLGATVGFNGETRTVTAKLGNISVEMVLDSNIAKVNGEEKVLDAPAILYGDYTFVPVRFLAESFKFKVDWNAEKQLITITKENKVDFPETEKISPDFLPEGGVIPNEEVAISVAKAILDGQNIKYEELSVNDDGESFSIYSSSGELMITLKKTNCEVLDFNLPKN